jgi:hypothetical protein
MSAHAFGDVHLAHGLDGLRPLLTLNATGNAAGAGVVGHEHEESAGQADEGGEGCTLVAALFLVHLNDHFLAFLMASLMLTRPPPSAHLPLK